MTAFQKLLIMFLSMILVVGLAVSATASEDDGVEAMATFNELRSDYPGVQAYRVDGRATRLYGTAFGTGASPEQTAQAFVDKYAGAFGARAADLAPRSLLADQRHTLPLMYDKETGEHKFTMVYFAQELDGIPIYGSELRLLVRNEPAHRLVWTNSTLRDLGQFSADKSLVGSISAEAEQAARIDEPDLTDFSSQQWVIFAGVDGDVQAPRMAVAFEGSSDFPQRFSYVVDPATGEILYKEDRIIFEDVSGNVSGMGTPGPKAMQCTPSTQQVFPYARVDITGGNWVYSNEIGDYTIPNGGTAAVTVNSMIRGQYFTVTNYVGSEESLNQVVTPPGPADFVHSAADNSELVRAQVNGYLNANEVRNWVLTYHPTYPTIASQTGFPVIVNRTDGYCPGNAWYDGSSINFCQSSSTYGNTSFASVSQHEYGHHVIASGGSGQGQYGEGMADCVAMLIADDPGLGYGFYLTQCNTPLRNADNTYQYPCIGEIHDCGQLLSGCVWSIRNYLIVDYPATYLEILSNLTVNSVPMHTGTEITPQITIDFLTLDDDDANLENGTPHWDYLCNGFADHNMDCPALALVWFDFPDGKPATIMPNQTTTVRVIVNPGATSPVPGTGMLYYSIDGGSVHEGTMTETAPNEYDAILPALSCDHQLQWYVQADDDGGATVTHPTDAPTTMLTAIVATSSDVTFRDNFEFDNGWTVGGSVSDGAWDRGVPVGGGDRGDPPTDYDLSGSCYLTDNVDDNSDVDGGTTMLYSPVLDLSAYGDAKIHYARWYSNNFGADPYNDIMQIWISDNGGGSWTLVETVGPTSQADGGWYTHDFWVTDFFTPTTNIQNAL